MVNHPKWLTKDHDSGETAEDVVDRIRKLSGVSSERDNLGNALAQIYARCSELLIERINRLPENYFRAFLNSAQVVPLAPQAARTELTFSLPSADDTPSSVLVPQGTQVATQQTESLPEIVFETLENLNVVPNRLLKCITFDRQNYCDCTEIATSKVVGKAFPVFQGTVERERMLFLGDSLFAYRAGGATTAGETEVAEVSEFEQAHTIFELRFQFAATHPSPTINGAMALDKNRELEWYFWDAGQKEPGWSKLANYRVEIPAIFEAELDAAAQSLDNSISDSLRGELERHGISISQADKVTKEESGAAWKIVDKDNHCKCRIQNDAARQGFADQPLQLFAKIVDDTTNAMQRDGSIRFRHLPILQKSTVDGKETYWLACRLKGVQEPSHLPVVKRIQVARYMQLTTNLEIPVDAAFSATQGGTVFTPLPTSQDNESPFQPFGPAPQRLDAFYLRSDQAFSQSGAKITLSVVNLDSAPDRLRTLDANFYHSKFEQKLPRISWEYHSENGWDRIALVEPTLQWEETGDGWRLKSITHTICGHVEMDMTSGFTDVSLSAEPTSAQHPQLIKLELRSAAGNQEPDPPTVESASVPKDESAERRPSASRPKRTIVNEQEGFWIRARIIDGAYGVEGELRKWLFLVHGWIPQVICAPVIQNLKLSSDHTEEPKYRDINYLMSRIDGTWRAAGNRVNAPAMPTTTIASASQLEEQKNHLRPFNAADEGPALYLGFERAFPEGVWIRLLLDVEENSISGPEVADSGSSRIVWQYWHKSSMDWRPLQAIDDTRGLVERNYLGFTAPKEHAPSTEFGQNAYWIRAALPSDRRPYARTIGHRLVTCWKSVIARGVEAIIPVSFHRRIPSDPKTLACDSFPQPEHLRKLTLQQVDRSSVQHDSQPWAIAQATEATLIWQRIELHNEAYAVVHIDASLSTPYDNTTSYITKYRLCRADSVTTDAPRSEAAPKQWRLERRLRGVRLNTVSAMNKETFGTEIIGLSNGNQNQQFSLARKPVLDDPELGVIHSLVLEVQEFDPPAKVRPPSVQSAITQDNTSVPVWHAWRRIDNFYEADQFSRVYTIDTTNGEIRFGDGKRGMIPLAGSKIRVLRYCIHAGSRGNKVGAGMINALRNPVGDISKIESVTNFEEARGGRDSEPDEDVMRRGPRLIKSQDRVVSAEDLAWIARQTAADIANAYATPTFDKRGRPLAGKAQVVVIPRRDGAIPVPTPVQSRSVKAHLETRVQANLVADNALVVRGPDYIAVSTKVWLVPENPGEGELIQRNVRERLVGFLHPLDGGPPQPDTRHQGWPLGRDLSVSELYAQVESVPGVDFVKRIRLQGSQLQFELSIKEVQIPLGEARPGDSGPSVTKDVTPGSQVGTLDERKKLILSESSFAQDHQELHLFVLGFNIGEEVKLLTESQKQPITTHIRKVEVHSDETCAFSGKFRLTVALDRKQLENVHSFETADGRIRLPISDVLDAPQHAPAPDNLVTATDLGADISAECCEVIVEGFLKGDVISLFVGSYRADALWQVMSTRLDEERIHVPDGYLICSGEHHVNIEVVGGDR